ncbi:nucleolus protein [Ceratobasidium sp. AG-I]|nr:nucleolus protein [Ceratobasidium sp. AG-I]
MARKRKTKTPITVSSATRSSLDSAKPKATRAVIRRFHVLIRRRAILQKQTARDVVAELELRGVEAEIESLGGLEKYQAMSAIGQGKDRGGGSEGVLIQWLRDMGLDRSVKGKGKGKEVTVEEGKLKLLEVGALKPDNYASCSSWVSCTPIDLRSRHPDILEQDFLRFDVDTHLGKLDVVSLSLVINFVPDAKDRGKMLQIAHDILRPSDTQLSQSPNGGLLFLVLPTPCVTNSRYMTSERLISICAHIGFALLQERCKAGGKVSYWLFARADDRDRVMGDPGGEFTKKFVLREGSDRNNFSILL